MKIFLVILMGVCRLYAGEPAPTPAQLEMMRKHIEAHSGEIGAAEEAARRQNVERLLSQFKKTGNTGFILAITHARPSESLIKSHVQPLLQSDDSAVRTAAIQVILGAEAVQPFLDDGLKLLDDPSDEVRLQAIRLIARMGAGGRAALPSLTRHLGIEKETLGRELVICLGLIGPPAIDSVAAIQAYVANRPIALQYEGYKAVGKIRNSPRPLLQDIVKSGHKIFLGVEGYSAFAALHDAENVPDEIWREVRDFLRDNSKPVEILQALETISSCRAMVSSRELADLIVEIGSKESGLISEFACRAISNLDPNEPDIYRLLQNQLGNSSELVALAASGRLLSRQRLNECEKQVISLLQQANGRSDDQLLVNALTILRRIGPVCSKEATNLVLSLLMEKAPIYQERMKGSAIDLRSHVFLAIGDIGVADSAFVEIVDALENANHTTVMACAARAARGLKDRKADIAVHFKRILLDDFKDSLMSLDSSGFRATADARVNTTVRCEVFRAMIQLQIQEDKILRPLVMRRKLDTLEFRPLEPSVQALAAEVLNAKTDEKHN